MGSVLCGLQCYESDRESESSTTLLDPEGDFPEFQHGI
jgi:hypothetical protein